MIRVFSAVTAGCRPPEICRGSRNRIVTLRIPEAGHSLHHPGFQ